MKKIDIEKYLGPNLARARRRSKEDVMTFEFSLDTEYLNLGNNLTYHILTFGCQSNVADSEVIAGILEKMNFKNTNKENIADVIILNTCAIRDNAESRVWGIVGRIKNIKRSNPDLILAISGCMPQEENVISKIFSKYPHIDIVFGTHNIYKLPEYLKTAIFSKEKVIEVFSKEGEIVENLPRTRNHQYKAGVNIMFGCDEFCTYCIVPYTRGKERSRDKEDIFKEVIELKELGYQEITLLGQNVNSYGKDFTNKNYIFGDLLHDLDKIGIPRIRFMTSHPHDLDEKTMYAIRDGKTIMPHFHLPVQAGSNSILKRMNRRYTKESFLNVLEKLKQIVPNISVTTDIIVGFPGEETSDFLETIDLVKNAQFEGAFTYLFSPREGTPAFNFQDNTLHEEKKKNLFELNKLVNVLYQKGNDRFVGETVRVLVDGPSKKNENILSGYSENYKVVNFPGSLNLIGKIVDVKVTKAKTWFLLGELV